MSTAVEESRESRAAVRDLAYWLRTSSAYDVLDDAVMGCLSVSTVAELVEDFGVSVGTFRRELSLALADGC